MSIIVETNPSDTIVDTEEVEVLVEVSGYLEAGPIGPQGAEGPAGDQGVQFDDMLESSIIRL